MSKRDLLWMAETVLGIEVEDWKKPYLEIPELPYLRGLYSTCLKTSWLAWKAIKDAQDKP